MKNLSLVLSGISLAAVIGLYAIHFGSKSSDAKSVTSAAPGNLKVAYINTDSVLKNYDYFKVSKDKFEAKGKKLNDELQARAQALQNEYNNYQRNLGNMTIGQAKAVEEDLGKRQQNLGLYQQRLEQELANEQVDMNNELYKKITEFLSKYGQERGLEVVFKYDQGSDLLFGNAGLDITQDVVKGLNEAYKLEASEPKKDSTSVKKK